MDLNDEFQTASAVRSPTNWPNQRFCSVSTETLVAHSEECTSGLSITSSCHLTLESGGEQVELIRSVLECLQSGRSTLWQFGLQPQTVVHGENVLHFKVK